MFQSIIIFVDVWNWQMTEISDMPQIKVLKLKCNCNVFISVFQPGADAG